MYHEPFAFVAHQISSDHDSFYIIVLLLLLYIYIYIYIYIFHCNKNLYSPSPSLEAIKMHSVTSSEHSELVRTVGPCAQMWCHGEIHCRCQEREV